MLLAAISTQPWLAQWNRAALEALFRLLPHNAVRDSIAQSLTTNQLVSTWLFAAAYYWYWRIEDDRTLWRRMRLAEIFLACLLATCITLAFRPWVGWPAPANSSGFRNLYPQFMWDLGTNNSFPSHSTLVYLLVAMGLWVLRRRVSLLLVAWTLLAISLPRIYVGGHHPIDVVASIILAVGTLGFVRWWCARASISKSMQRVVSGGLLTELCLFLWLFELAEGFMGSVDIFYHALHAIGR